MDEKCKQFEEVAVRLLFKRISEGRFKLVRGVAPRLGSAIEAVQLDQSGQPIMATANNDVRRAAIALAQIEIDQHRKKTMNPIDELMPKQVEVSALVLKACGSRGKFTALTLELFKEAGCLAAVAAHSFVANDRTDYPFERNQAICAGLLVRIFKLMMAICRLAATGDGAEVNLPLMRSVYESATSLRYLLLKNDSKLFDRFVTTSLGPERELFDMMQEVSRKRGGKLRPFEQRILAQIEDVCRRSGVQIQSVKMGHQKWGGSERDKLVELKVGERYVFSQRFPSHSVHGDWVDLVMFHLKAKDGRFGIQPKFWPNTPAIYIPVAIFVLEAVEDYLKAFFSQRPEIKLLLTRITDVQKRIRRVNRRYEAWVIANPPTEDYPQ